MTPHGTPNGYNAGCRGNGNCDNHHTHLMTCKAAIVRYRGDYTYRLMVDQGMTPQQIVDAERAQLVLDRIARKAAPRKTLIHGTSARYRAGCRVDSECPATPSCHEEMNAYRRANHVWKSDPTFPHGKASGYQRGCHDPAQCPAEGISCREAKRVQSTASKAIRRANTAPKSRPAAVHGTCGGYRSLKCHDRSSCPAVAQGGAACSDMKATYDRAKRARRRVRDEQQEGAENDSTKQRNLSN